MRQENAEARKNALTEAQRRSPLGPATEAARRTGHGVAVLLKICAHCIDGQADAANQRITDALGIEDSESEPGDEQDGDSEQASWKVAGQGLEEPAGA